MDTKEEVRQLKDDAGNLQQLKALYIKQANELKFYQENIIPSKDKIIEQLSSKVAELSGW